METEAHYTTVLAACATEKYVSCIIPVVTFIKDTNSAVEIEKSISGLPDYLFNKSKLGNSKRILYIRLAHSAIQNKI